MRFNKIKLDSKEEFTLYCSKVNRRVIMYTVKVLNKKTINNQNIVTKNITGICALHKITKMLQSFKDLDSAKVYCSKNDKGTCKIPSYPTMNDIAKGQLSRVGEVGNWEFYEVNYYDTVVIMPNGEKIKRPSYANAIRYCIQHKEYLASRTKKAINFEEEVDKEKEKKRFRVLTSKRPSIVIASAVDRDKATRAIKEGKLTLDDLHFYAYAASVKVFNYLISQIDKYLMKEDLLGEVEKKGFWDKYIFDREMIDKWVDVKKQTIGYMPIIFAMLKEVGVITVCGAGYLFDTFHSAIEVSLEELSKLEDINKMFEKEDMEWLVYF